MSSRKEPDLLADYRRSSMSAAQSQPFCPPHGHAEAWLTWLLLARTMSHRWRPAQERGCGGHNVHMIVWPTEAAVPSI